MPQFNNIVLVKEETVGEGSPLLFPGVSSCSAVVAVVGNTLVGAHFTRDLWTGPDPAAYTEKLLTLLETKIGDRTVGQLLIVGYNDNHNPPKLRDRLGVAAADCLAYDVGRKNVDDMLLIFTHQGAGTRPRVEWKRTSKVTTQNAADFVATHAMRHVAQGGSATTGTLHELRQHFVALP